MAQNTKIEWCDHTINLWHGCSKVHTGCKKCYAEALANRFGNDIWGEKKQRLPIKSAFLDLERYQKKAKKLGIKYKIFCGSMMDIFEDDKIVAKVVPNTLESIEDLRQMLFNEITNDAYPNLIFLFLTKRPENIAKMIPMEWSHGLSNVWFGTSISNAETCVYAEKLQNLKHQNLFLSIEPQVGRISESDLHLKGIDWIIQGGESGPDKRPFDIQWAYEMKDICQRYEIPYFFKQIDKVQPVPQDLQIQQFPNFL